MVRTCLQAHPGAFAVVTKGSGRGLLSFADPETCIIDKAQGTTNQRAAFLMAAACRCLYDRRAICDCTDLPMTIVDDHVKNLKDDGEIRMVVPGIFEPVDQTPDRAVSGTMVPNGRYKLEVGDTSLDLTLREARAVAVATGGGLLLGR